jgi:Condensation domain
MSHEISADAVTRARDETVRHRSRPLLLLERTMYREGRTPFTSVFTIQLLGRLDEMRLRRALASLQAKHPLLRCVVEEAADGPRFVLQERPEPIGLRIVDRKDEHHWEDEVRREWVTPFEPRCEPLVRMVWLRASEVSELILVAHHCICDGQSGINLLRECLRACEDPEQEPTAYEELGALEDLVPPELLRDSGFRRRARWKVLLLRIVLEMRRRKKPKTQLRIAHDEMYFHRWSMDVVASLVFTERCRAEQVTVLSAISVALVQAFREVRGVKAPRQAYTMVNARRFMARLRPDTLFGLAPGVPLNLKGLPALQEMTGEAFWQSAQTIGVDLARRVKRLGAGIYEYLVGFEGLHDKYERLVADTEAAPPVRHVTVSNMGKIDLPQRYEGFWLERMYSPLVMVSPTPANTLILSSFAGRLEFALVSDELSLTPAHAVAIEQRMMEILRRCANLPAPHGSGAVEESYAMRGELR